MIFKDVKNLMPYATEPQMYDNETATIVQKALALG